MPVVLCVAGHKPTCPTPRQRRRCCASDANSTSNGVVCCCCRCVRWLCVQLICLLVSTTRSAMTPSAGCTAQNRCRCQQMCGWHTGTSVCLLIHRQHHNSSREIQPQS